jgi:hypothetical protein
MDTGVGRLTIGQHRDPRRDDGHASVSGSGMARIAGVAEANHKYPTQTTFDDRILG